MAKCPVCEIDLLQIDYEGFKILQCSKCRGHLIDDYRVESIKRTKKNSTEELKGEAKKEFVRNTGETIRCPRCRITMRKERTKRLIELFLDKCDPCKVFWFDGGELAILQLIYETSPAFLNAPDSWSNARLRGTFDTLQLFTKDGKPLVKVPYEAGGVGIKLEPYTKYYPEYGEGGAVQLVPIEKMKIKLKEIQLLREN